MLIFRVVKNDINRLLQWGILLYCLAAVVIFFWVMQALLQSAPSATRAEKTATGRKTAGAAYMYPLETIGTGALALRPKIARGWVARLAEEVCVIAYNSRPDVAPREVKILIALSDGIQQSTSSGKILYLQERTEGKGLRITGMPTALWIKPILLDDGHLLIEAGRKLLSKDGSAYGEEKGEFITSAVAGKSSAEAPTPYFEELKEGGCLGHDALIAQYGGKEYASWGEKVKVEFTQGGRSYACFVASGDLLYYREGEWRAFSPDDASASGLPLARVVAAAPKGVEIEAWDETGFVSMHAKIEGKKGVAGSSGPDLLPTSLRLRSKAQVSCAFGKKRLIIKKGDWLLKTPHGWRNLRRTQEIEDVIHHRLKGELFIFDDMEKQQGKYLLRGHLFDTWRTQATPITLPIDMEKREKKQK